MNGSILFDISKLGDFSLDLSFWFEQKKRKKLKCYWKITFKGIPMHSLWYTTSVSCFAFLELFCIINSLYILCQMWIMPWSSRETSWFCKRNGRFNCSEPEVCPFSPSMLQICFMSLAHLCSIYFVYLQLPTTRGEQSRAASSSWNFLRCCRSINCRYESLKFDSSVTFISSLKLIIFHILVAIHSLIMLSFYFFRNIWHES